MKRVIQIFTSFNNNTLSGCILAAVADPVMLFLAVKQGGAKKISLVKSPKNFANQKKAVACGRPKNDTSFGRIIRSSIE